MLKHLINRIKSDMNITATYMSYNVGIDIKNNNIYTFIITNSNLLRFYIRNNQINYKGYFHKNGLIYFTPYICAFKDVILCRDN
jgi:hypothetical protein